VFVAADEKHLGNVMQLVVTGVLYPDAVLHDGTLSNCPTAFINAS